jgi:predicted subunit of tRNA(5-methylaminomethyl-2-thiouridylate) methyltransferase
VLIAPATETSTAVDGAFTMLKIKNNLVRKEFDKIIFEKSGYPTEWFSIKRAMKNIKAAVLWIHDESDDITPLADALKVKSEQFSNIRFIITKGLGHKKIYRDNDIKNEVINFL